MNNDNIDDDTDLKNILSHPPQKHSVNIAGHATSITIEAPFWNALKKLAAIEGISLRQLIAMIDHHRHDDVNLSAALRLYVLDRL